MKKVLIILIVVGALLTSCAPQMIITTQAPTTTPTGTSNETPTETQVNTVPTLQVIDPVNGATYEIKEGVVGVGNADISVMYSAGLTARYSIFILNGTDAEKTFNVRAKPYSNSDWSPAPDNIQDWVNFNNSLANIPIQIAVPSMSAKPVSVALTVPVGEQVPGSWAFIVSVTEYPRVIATGGFTSLSYDMNNNKVTFSWALIPTPNQNTSGVGGKVNTSGFPSKVMIRAKEGGYPINPPNMNTAPSDGRVLYYGDGYSVTSVTDTQVTPFTFYAIWVQRVDGSWYTNSGMSFLPEATSRWTINMR